MYPVPIYSKLSWEHSHSKMLCYPQTAGAAALVNIPTNAVANAYGAWTQIIPASTFTQSFDIHYMTILQLPSTDEYIFQLACGASDELIATVAVEKAAVQASVNGVPVITAKSDPSWMGDHGLIAPTDKISARVQRSVAGAVNCHIFLMGHGY